MAEEQDKKAKPKATLIKHKKQPESVEGKGEDDSKPRKVVVVRKKRVVVKADPSKTADPVIESPAEVKREEAEAPKAEKPKVEAVAEEKPVKTVETPKVEAETVRTEVPEPKRVEEKADTVSQPEAKPRTEQPAARVEDQQPLKEAPSASPKAAAPSQRSGQRPSSGDQRPSGQRTSAPPSGQRAAPPRTFGASGDDSRFKNARYGGPRSPGHELRSNQQRPAGRFNDTRGRESGQDSRPAPGRSDGPHKRIYKRTDSAGPGRRDTPGTGRPPRPGAPRPGAPRPGAPRPGGRPTGRPTGGRPGPGRPGTTPPPTTTAAPKPGGKKFVRSKKAKEAAVYRREEQERDFQIKKRQNQPKANPVPKEIDIMEVITVSELARKMNLKASEVIGKLMGMGMMVTINQQIDAETATLVAAEYTCKVKIVSLYEETIIETEDDSEDDLKARPPIVTVMGHVDHGKTKLLDTIRQTDVVAGEFGGITQHIGAYKVKLKQGELVFLDTPGHEAFTLMRARGAQITDIVILVVASDDGVMPQTVEAVNHAKAAGVPIIVAVNKSDLPNANPDRVKQQLSEYNLIPEDWGGNTMYCNVSALTGDGVPELLESLLLQAELLELKANYTCRAEGKVIESRVDHGRGIVGTVLVERGTLKVGDSFVAGVYPGKVRAMFDDKGNRIEEAPPATPIEILGLTGIPDAGAPFQVTESEREARQVGAKRQELEKQGTAKNVNKITLDNLYDSMQDGAVQELKVIIKGDVHGSVEALQTALEKLSTDLIRLNVIHASAGAIIENDVNLATASNAIIIGFHVRPTPKALELAEQEKVEVRKYNIIYKAVEDIQAAMEGLLEPDLKEEVIGTVEVREVFKVPKIGQIAGCYVTSGRIRRNADVHIVRDGIELHTGKVTSLKRFKDDAREVESGYECGVAIDNYLDVQPGDQFEVFEVREVAKKL